MKNIIKKLTAIAMCGVLTVGSVLMTGAVSEYEDRKDFEVTGTRRQASRDSGQRAVRCGQGTVFGVIRSDDGGTRFYRIGV